MKLTAKLVLVFLAGILLIQSLNAYVLTRREGEQFEDEMRQHAQYLAESMKEQLGDSAEQTSERAGLLARQMDRDHRAMRVRFVYLQNWPNNELRPYAPTERLRITYGEIYSFPQNNEDGERVLRVYSPVGEMEGKPTGLELTGSFADADKQQRTILVQHVVVAAATLLCALGVSIFGVKLVGNRLTQLIQKTNRIAAGDFSDPVRVKGNDELSQLATALNGMCDALAKSQQKIRAESTARVAAVQQLRHADRLNTVGRLASGVAHELGTPLNVVAGRAGLIASGKLNDEEVRKSAHTIKDEADRITGIIRQLLDFARRGTPQRAVVDLRDITRQTVDLLGPMAEKRQVTISTDLGESPLRARVDVGQIQQVLTNLTVNAMQAMPEGGEIKVTLGTANAVSPNDSAAGPQTCFRLSVQDGGQGITEGDLPHLFEPFFTTKDVGEGTGLGLSVSYGIAQDHDGWIDVNSVPGQGSCFTVYLPQEANQCSDES
jgi:two-component system NtrC family sensor kinase